MITVPLRLDPDDGAFNGPSVTEFLATMPARYRESFDASAARQHARVAAERGDQPAHVGLFDGSDSRGPALCVVARDAPGVLAAISASLMLEGFDVMQAEAFTRTPLDGSPEAVDLFWVRRELTDPRGPLTEQDARAVQSTLVPLLRGEVGVRRGTKQGAPSATPASAQTSVQFIERESEPWLTLELHTNDRSGLLLSTTAALLGEGVQITGCRVTTDGTRVNDRFDLVERDGSRIPRGRLQRIQLAVLVAIDGY